MKKAGTFVVMLLLLALGAVPPAWGAASKTSDAEDGADVAELAHEDTDELIRYTVTAFDAIRSDDVRMMRWDLDLDSDGRANGSRDACIVLRPQTGRGNLRADLYRGCEGDPVAGADTRPRGNTLKVRFLVSELRAAGLDDDADGYGYRFEATAADGSSDEVPDDVRALIRHSLRTSGPSTDRRDDTADEPASSDDVVVGQSSTFVDTPPDAAEKPAAAAKRERDEAQPKDTEAAGTAEQPVVEPGDDVEIHASGFAGNQPLAVSLIGTGAATSTATASPSASASPSPTPTTTGTGNTTSAQAQDVVEGRAAAGTGTSIGVATSDDEGNLDDEVDIPEETKPADYTIVVRGRNDTGGTHTVSIPIEVAAEVDNGASGDDATNGQVTNAPGTATQAPTTPVPVAQTGTQGGTNLPATGSPHLTLFAQLGTMGLLLGGSLLFARRRLHAAVAVDRGAMPPFYEGSTVSAFDFGELRGEMQRLLALRPDRDDPYRYTDL